MIFLILILLYSLPSLPAYSYPMLGTQIIGPSYHFTTDHPVVEGAKRIAELGSEIVKIKLMSGPEFDTIVSLPFTYVFIYNDKQIFTV